MTDRSMNDTALIDRLTDLGEQLDAELAGAADGLADSVVARIRVERPERSSHRVFTRRTGLWSVAAAVLLLVVVLIAVPGPRRTIARWFGVGSVRIEPVATTTPSTTPGAEVAPATTVATVPVAEPEADTDLLGLGPAVGADEAVAATGLPLPVATSLDEPVSYHLPGGPQIVARYDVDGRTVLVAVLAGTTEEAAFFKQVDPEQVTFVDVPGIDGESVRGLWIEGEPHTFGYLDADGEFAREPLRLAGDTLLWERAGATLRVEGARNLEEALEIAGSMEP